MKKVIETLNGNKTYITLFIGAIIYTLKYWGKIDEKMFDYLMTLDMLLVGGAVRHALSKLEK